MREIYRFSKGWMTCMKKNRVKFTFKLLVKDQTKVKNNAPSVKFGITVLDLISMLLLAEMTIT